MYTYARFFQPDEAIEITVGLRGENAGDAALRLTMQHYHEHVVCQEQTVPAFG